MTYSSSSTSVLSSTGLSSMRILTIGPSEGQVGKLIAKASAIQSKHGPFDALFIVGDFFHSSQSLNQEEQALLDGITTLPIRTFVTQARRTPPPQIRQRIQSHAQRVVKQDQDHLPIHIAGNLSWLPNNQVCWISQDASHTHRMLDNDIVDVQEQKGLRVAVCGGRWDPTKWAAEIQGRGGIAAEGSSVSSHQVQEDDLDFILPSSLEKLYLHRAFHSLTPLHPITAQSNPTGREAEPQTLAAARAKLQAERSGSADASSSSNASRQPTIDLLILPTWPAGVSLFSKAFPPAGVPEEARMWGLHPVAELLRRAKPRYAFAIAPEPDVAQLQTTSDDPAINSAKPDWQETGVFWEREPYTTVVSAARINSSSTAGGIGSGSNALPIQSSPPSMRVSRFISLANFANAKKVRWFVALNLTTGVTQESAQTTQAASGLTRSPFAEDVRTVASKGIFGKGGDKKRKADETLQDGQGLQSDVNFRWQKSSGGGAGRKKALRTEGGAPLDDDAPPPPGYVCVVCGSQEHYVRLCPHKQQHQQEQRRLRQQGGSGNHSVDLGLPNRPEGAEEALGPLHRREPVQMVGPKDCWFCLSNTGCAKHLVVAIGQESYLALPKGQLPPSSSEASPVPGGGHVLIIPMAHVPSVQSLEPAQARENLIDEIERYLSSLHSCYQAYGCIAVAWSIVKLSNTRAGHMQIQVVPVPQERIMAGASANVSGREGGAETASSGSSKVQDFETYLRSEAKKRGYDLKEVIDDDGEGEGDAATTATPAVTASKRIGSSKKEEEYFQIDILSSSSSPTSSPSSSTTQRITYRLDLTTSKASKGDGKGDARKSLPPVRFDYQFPRGVLASYLHVPDRVDWRKCARSEKVEEVETRMFRDAFAEWMPQFDDEDDDDEEEEEDDEE